MSLSMEDRIIEAAKTLFFKNGFVGTSTTDIAKLAGCNQALVHYYFRTKDKLFCRIFEEQAGWVMQLINQSLSLDVPFEQQIRHAATLYFDFLSEHKELPWFVLTELIRDAQRRAELKAVITQKTQFMDTYQRFEQRVRHEVEEGHIVPIEPQDIILHIVSLVVFCFLSLPLYTDVFQLSDEETAAYIDHRKEETIRLILQGLKPSCEL